MAETIAALDETQTIIIAAAGTCVKVIPPRFTRYLWIQPLQADTAWSYEGTDGGAIAGSPMYIKTEQWVEFQHQGDRPIYLVNDSSGSEVVISARSRE